MGRWLVLLFLLGCFIFGGEGGRSEGYRWGSLVQVSRKLGAGQKKGDWEIMMAKYSPRFGEDKSITLPATLSFDLLQDTPKISFAFGKQKMHVTQWIQLKSFVRNEEDEETMSEMVLDSLTIQFFCHEEHISDIDLTPTYKFKTPNNNNNNDNNNNHNNNNNNNNIPLTIHYQWERETPTLDVDVGLVVFFLGSFLVSSVSVVFILVEFLALEYPGQDFFSFGGQKLSLPTKTSLGL